MINGVAAFNEIPIYEGTVIEKNFTFSARNPQQKFILPNVGIDTDLIRVGVKNNEFSTATVKYSLQDNIFYVGSDSKVYFLQEVSDERYEIFFGDGVFGKKLDDQNYVTVTYLVTNGDAGNGFSQFSFNGRLTYVRDGSEYTVTSGISLITPEYSSRGGSAIEEVESVRKYAPKIYSTQNRAVTADDYETLIPAKIYPDTESISVFGGEELIPPQYGKVFISIKPRFGDFLPNLIKDNIKLKLKKYAVAGVVPEILDLKYLYLEVSSRVYYNTNLAPSAAEVSTIVSNNAAKYADSTELNKYGARFKYSKFLKIIDDSHESVTSNITVVKMRRDLRVVPNTIAEYQIGFGNQFHISNMTGYNIKTSSFRVSGIAENVYIGDIPNSNRQTGTLFFFTVPNIGSQSPVVIRSNVGTIDYVNGIITINAINIIAGMQKDSQEIIEIQATPLSNDVVGLQDLYLQLDTSNSTFEMVSDEIASGLDPSASNYIVSSSYAEGNLVRAGGPDNVITTAATDAVNATTSTNSSFTGTTTVTTSTSGATGGSSTPSGSGSGY